MPYLQSEIIGIGIFQYYQIHCATFQGKLCQHSGSENKIMTKMIGSPKVQTRLYEKRYGSLIKTLLIPFSVMTMCSQEYLYKHPAADEGPQKLSRKAEQSWLILRVCEFWFTLRVEKCSNKRLF